MLGNIALIGGGLYGLYYWATGLTTKKDLAKAFADFEKNMRELIELHGQRQEARQRGFESGYSIGSRPLHRQAAAGEGTETTSKMDENPEVATQANRELQAASQTAATSTASPHEQTSA